MREILFKAIKKYDIERKREWIYSKSLLDSQESGNIENITMLKNDGIWCEIKPETLCQYIELKDKRGGKIFDGDLVKVKNILYGEIRWNKFRWMIYERKIDQYSSFLFINSNDIEVIGSIHDAKE